MAEPNNPKEQVQGSLNNLASGMTRLAESFSANVDSLEGSIESSTDKLDAIFKNAQDKLTRGEIAKSAGIMYGVLNGNIKRTVKEVDALTSKLAQAATFKPDILKDILDKNSALKKSLGNKIFLGLGAAKAPSITEESIAAY